MRLFRLGSRIDIDAGGVLAEGLVEEMLRMNHASGGCAYITPRVGACVRSTHTGAQRNTHLKRKPIGRSWESGTTVARDEITHRRERDQEVKP